MEGKNSVIAGKLIVTGGIKEGGVSLSNKYVTSTDNTARTVETSLSAAATDKIPTSSAVKAYVDSFLTGLDAVAANVIKDKKFITSTGVVTGSMGNAAGTTAISGGGLSGGGEFDQTASVSIKDDDTNIAATVKTSKPTSGYYLTITGGADGATKTITRAAATGTSKITTAGYAAVTAANSSFSSGSLAEGTATVKIKSASATKYYEIPSAVGAIGNISGGGLSLGTATAPTISVSGNTTPTYNSGTGKYDFALSGSSTGGGNTVTRAKATVDASITTDGYITTSYDFTAKELASDSKSATAANGTGTGTLSLNKGACAATASITSHGSVALSLSDVSTGTTINTTNSSGVSFKLKGTKTDGSAKATSKISTTGYVVKDTAGTDNSATITPGITGESTYYINQVGAIASGKAFSTGNVSGTLNTGLTSSGQIDINGAFAILMDTNGYYYFKH